MNFAIAKAIKEEFDVVFILLKILLLDLLYFKIHVDLVMRLNVIDDKSKNVKSVHFFVLFIWANPSVDIFELFTGLTSGLRKAFQKLMSKEL